jgi:hypothetical protein
MAKKPGHVYHWKHGWIPLDPSVDALEPPSRALELRGYDELSPSLQGKINAKLEALTGLKEPDLAEKVQANLARLYQQGNPADGDWYYREGADIASRAASVRADFPDSKLTQEQLTGMIAVTSAKKRWVDNKEFAEAIARKLAADQPFYLDQKTIDAYNGWASKRSGGETTVHPELKPGTYRPSELPVDFAAVKTPDIPRHLNADYVIRAARIYRGEPMDKIIGGPKQRSFVNNLTDPSDKRFATIDTWQYKASMSGIPLTRTVGPKGAQKTYSYTLEQWADRELTTKDGRAAMYGYDPALDRYDPQNLNATIKAADSMTPQGFFQSGPSSVADGWKGNNGTYPWFVKQTQLAAEQLGVSPNDLQAVAWYTQGGGE